MYNKIEGEKKKNKRYVISCEEKRDEEKDQHHHPQRNPGDRVNKVRVPKTKTKKF